MKKLLTALTALVLTLVLVGTPVPLLASIGDVGTGTDTNGVYYQRAWLDGNWSEYYSIGDSYWGVWIEEGTPDTPGTETGDYYSYSHMIDGSGTVADYWDYLDNGISEFRTEIQNSNTGYYFLDYYYDALTLSDPMDSYYESIYQLDDPLSGASEYDYLRGVDFDDDGSYYDDWYYEAWNYYEPGTGDGDEGYSLYNYIDGIQEYDDYDYNTLTGDYDIDRDYYEDTDLDGGWYDNYYTYYDEYYDAYDGEGHMGNDIYDYDAVVYDSATYYSYDYYYNSLTGDWSETTDARFDTDGDGSWDDFGYLGATPGAYRYYKNEYLDTYENYSYSQEQTWDALNNVYMDNYTEEYLGTGYSDTWFSYRWDYDQDGSYSDDYYYYGESYTNYYGEDYQRFYSYDYLSANATYYDYYYNANPVNGYLYTDTDYRYDTDGDGDWNDYSSNGAYRSYSEEYNYPDSGEYYMEYYTYTPGADDYSTLFTYDYYEYYKQGDYWYEYSENAIDADFDDYLWDYSGGSFGGAYYTETYSEYYPDYYDYYYTESDTYDPWSNYAMFTYSETYTDPVNPGTPFYSYGETDLHLDTDDDNSYTDNYYIYTAYESDQYYGDGYTWTYTQIEDQDNGEYLEDYSESYATGTYYNYYEYALDTDADGTIEHWYGDDFYNYTESSYCNDDGETYAYEWISDDYNNNRGAYWYSRVENYSYATGSFDNRANSANLAGFVGEWSGYDADDGRSYDATGFSVWGEYNEASGSYAYDAGDSGSWTEYNWDTDGDTAWNNTGDYEIWSETWDEYEGSWHYVGYSLDDYNTGNEFFQENQYSANFDLAVWETYDGATGNRNELVFEFASGSSVPSMGSSEWWYGTPSPNDYEYYLYSGDAGDWYLVYYY